MLHHRLNLGKINYLNCWPLFKQLPENLNCDSFNLISGHPARLNQGLKNGEIDISPSSSMLLADNNSDDYFILPDVGITSVSEVRSVILLSRRTLPELIDTTISLTNHSLTSIYLLKIILFHFHQLDSDRLTFINEDFKPEYSFNEAALLIGDQALEIYHRPPAGYRVYDLGKIWHQFTGLPFVYALWIGRKAAITEKGKIIIELHNSLNKIISRLPENLERMTSQALTEKAQSSRLTSDQLLAYWRNTIFYNLDQPALDGLNLFYKLAKETGLIQDIPKLDFFPKI